MLFNVPQYIDIEDKIAGPLTARQLMWMVGMGAVLLVLWNIFDKATFFVLAIPVILLFVALAFYKPYGQPLIFFIGNTILFLIKPKVYIWNRPTKVARTSRKNETSQEKNEKTVKVITAEEISRLSQIVDKRK